MSDVTETINNKSSAFDLVAPYYDILMEPVPYRFWLKYLQTLWNHHKHEPMNVIDLACGTGTLSILMAEKGLMVTGVDLSEKMLDQARQKSSEKGLFVDFVQQDAAELDLGDELFDTVISLFDSLNNIIDVEALQNCFRSVRKHLDDTGIFIFDVNTEYAFRQGMFNQKSIPSDGPLQYRWSSEYNHEIKLCKVSMKFDYLTESGERLQFEELHIQRAYSNESIIRMLTQAGFSKVSIYDAYTVSPPKRRSDRLFFVAQAAV